MSGGILHRPAAADGSGAPAGLRPAVAATLASFGAQWADYSQTGARPEYRDTPAALIPLPAWADAIGRLRSEHGYDLLIDHTAVDYPDRVPRFTLVAVLESLATHERVLVKARVAVDEPAPTLSHLYASANWAERETYDMFGIPFDGHPDLTRIYMPQDYEGWPMRRDFPLEGHLKFRD
jgi:NADH-quinone oxidoreductase subunit C